MLDINSLIPYARNARTHSEAQIAQIAGSIKEFGFTNPILIDKSAGIIAGHGRVSAARKLNLTEVPCIRLEHLSETQRKAYILADNRIALNSGWEAEFLSTELEELKDLGINLESLGFDSEEIDALLNKIEPTAGLTDEDEAPEVQEQAVTKPGDIWVLGNHRLMCGDSTSIDAVDKLMPETADMAFTDPPYLMNFTGGINRDGSKSFNAQHGRIANDKMSKQEGDDFLDAINTIIASKVRGAFYITFCRLGIDRYYASMQRTGLRCRSLIIWDKGNHTLSNSDYMSMYEPMFYGWVKDHAFYGGNTGMDIWRVERTKKNDLHPTMKPVALVEKALTDGSKAKEVVLDLFGGSGSTLIACEKVGRVSRLMELDPKYCDVIVKRWQAFTGKKAILEQTGKTYEELTELSGLQNA
jgi:DNA modification methylase